MDIEYLHFDNRESLYAWYLDNIESVNEVFIEVKKGNPNNIFGTISYLDAVEVALCFGFIDSTLRVVDKKTVIRFSQRKPHSLWTELNKERCRRLIKRNEMTKRGFDVLPDLNKEYEFPKYIIDAFKKDEDAYNFFLSCPALYQRIRIYNVDFYHHINEKQYETSLKNLISKCHTKKMYGEWNDYGRLLNY